MKQIVEVRPAAPGNPVQLVYGIGDEHGAAVLVINTGWGIENGPVIDYYPAPTGLWWHTPKAPPEAEDYCWCHQKDCSYIGNAECWSQIISDSYASELLGLLRREGLGKVWIALELIYRERVGASVPEAVG